MLNFAFTANVLERIAEIDRPLTVDGAEHLVVVFENGFGMSILRGEYTHGGPEGLFEVVVLGKDKEHSEGDPFGHGEIIGWLTDEDVVNLAIGISLHTAEAQHLYEEEIASADILDLFESIRVAILRTDVEEDPRDPDNPAKFLDGVDVSPEARQAVKSTAELFIRKIEDLKYTVPTFLREVLKNLAGE